MTRPRDQRAIVVTDLGFGDAGKGLVVDALVRRTGAAVVVRYNGGAQAGHNVVTPDGRHHTFAQFGSGSFVPGTRTILSCHVVIHPTALLVEAGHLAAVGVPDALERLTISRGALVITPVHQAANRLRELARGPGHRHGSCGVGVGEAVGDALSHPDDATGDTPIRAGQLDDPHRLRQLLDHQRQRKRAELEQIVRQTRDLPGAAAEIAVLESPAAGDRWIDAVGPLAKAGVLADDRHIATAIAAAGTAAGTVVFEGAQGLLLDQWAGFHPHTTWSDCTPAGALELLRQADFPGEITRLGVTRVLPIRHGPGPFPTEDPALTATLVERHNGHDPWQGPVRRGHPDLVLLRYAAEACASSGGLDALAVTHLDDLDRLDHLDTLQVATAYRLADGSTIDHLEPPQNHDLDRQEQLTRTLAGARPRHGTIGGGSAHRQHELLARLATAAGAPVWATSSGPRAPDICWRDLG